MRSDTDTNKTAVSNLFHSSENFQNWSKTASVIPLVGNLPTISSPYNTYGGVYFFDGIAASGNYVAQAAGEVNKTYTFTLHAKPADLQPGYTLTMLVGGGGNNFGYAYNLNTNTVTSTGVPAGTTFSGRIQTLQDGWKRCVLTFNTPNTLAPLFFNGVANTRIHLFGAQLEEGTIPTEYIKTEATAPVYGNQDLLINQYPGIQGFGAWGATFNSSLNQQITKRQATAWGTIVIPGISGSNIIPPAYLESAYGVNNLVVGTTAGYDVYFTNEMGNTGYCVVASLEQENVYETESTTRGAATSIPPSDEFAMLVLNTNPTQTDTQRTKQKFTLRCFRQNSSDFFFSERNIHCNRGRTQRIHFMVFGGKSSYAAS